VPGAGKTRSALTIVDPAWASVDWTIARAIRTGRFWWIVLGYFLALVAWYVVQVHQTKYLIDVGFSPLVAAWALGIVSVVAIPGQIGFGALSDRIGREWVWSAGCFGFAVCYAALIALERVPSPSLLYLIGDLARLPGICPDAGHGGHRCGDLRGTALRRHIRHHHRGPGGRRRGRAVGRGRHPRRDRKLRARLSSDDCLLRRFRSSDLDCGSAQGAPGARPGTPAPRLRSGLAKTTTRLDSLATL